MSMMMPPEAPPGMPLPPGGGGEIPPMDAMSSTPLPAEGGIGGLIAALQGGGGVEGMGMPGGPMEGMPEGMTPDGALEDEGEDLSSVELIQRAMKLLLLAMAREDDDERGMGITKGMGALQSLLGGEQKRQKVLADAGG